MKTYIHGLITGISLSILVIVLQNIYTSNATVKDKLLPNAMESLYYDENRELMRNIITKKEKNSEGFEMIKEISTIYDVKAKELIFTFLQRKLESTDDDENLVNECSFSIDLNKNALIDSIEEENLCSEWIDKKKVIINHMARHYETIKKAFLIGE